MTSGSKGFHVVVPLAPTVDFEGAGHFALAAAVLLSHRHPKQLTTEFLKKERKGRVFIDWLRNGFGATGVCPYSLRPRPGAPIALPIGWGELDTTQPDGFRLRDSSNRLDAPDPWKSTKPQDLRPALEAAGTALTDHDLELPAFDRFGR
jgi:bifunctional non-homologous end joining protein LigD